MFFFSYDFGNQTFTTDFLMMNHMLIGKNKCLERLSKESLSILGSNLRERKALLQLYKIELYHFTYESLRRIVKNI